MKPVDPSAAALKVAVAHTLFADKAVVDMVAPDTAPAAKDIALETVDTAPADIARKVDMIALEADTVVVGMEFEHTTAQSRNLLSV